MKKKWFRKIIIIICWLVVWQFISLCVGNHILLVGPVETVLTLGRLLIKKGFWGACLGSCLRILSGFVTGMFIGIVLAVCSARHPLLEEILAPVMTLIKAVPVASFVVIFLIWWGSAQLAAVISFCIVLPNLYINTLEGIKSTDKQLLEMARVFELPAWNRFFYIYRPAVKPFLDSGIMLAAGMSWKSGVAAEVIGLPAHAIGEQLYMSKIYLDTAGVLAWTLITILLSSAFERAVLYLWKQFCRWEPHCQLGRDMQSAVEPVKSIRLIGVTRRYHGKAVVDNMTAEYEPGKIYFFRSPSGSGKTTLFRMLAGLEKPEEGVIDRNGQRVALLFQENRLCESYSALKNVELVTGDVELAKQHLLQLLEEPDLYRPCSELSGGMKRRVALARTLAASAPIILLDEPYNGLDEANRTRVHDYIEHNSREAIVLMASHIQ